VFLNQIKTDETCRTLVKQTARFGGHKCYLEKYRAVDASAVDMYTRCPTDDGLVRVQAVLCYMYVHSFCIVCMFRYTVHTFIININPILCGICTHTANHPVN
jgi:hypothetical protein